MIQIKSTKRNASEYKTLCNSRKYKAVYKSILRENKVKNQIKEENKINKAIINAGIPTVVIKIRNAIFDLCIRPIARDAKKLATDKSSIEDGE
jgi:hypothetical protein